MTVITRFAPSPTGFLHIGGARTALFNWLFAKHHGGKFLLRVEDTDKVRSTQAAIDAILEGMKWLDLDHDGEIVLQSLGAKRHREVAERLVKEGNAYYCYCTQEELAAMREEAQQAGKPFHYDRRWRYRDPSEAPRGVKPAIRLKAPLDGEMVIEDKVQGIVRVAHSELDDMILLRSDGTPTYMLSVVVDDHDMGITHIIRGDDHLTNAFRQQALYDALDWDVPEFAHIPLIHGADGAKLSKRHGALGVDAYREMGFLPEAIRNYLLRLGWSHGDEEIICTEDAIKWFNLDAVGKAPSRFDFAKLENVNGHYIREADNMRLVKLITPLLEEMDGVTLNDTKKLHLLNGMHELKQRAKTIPQLAESALIYAYDIPLPMDDKAAAALNEDGREIVADVQEVLSAITDADWSHDLLHQAVADYAAEREQKLGKMMLPIRAALTGMSGGPSVFDILSVLGKEESLKRLSYVIQNRAAA